MGTASGKKHIAHTGSGHGCISPPMPSLVSPPAPPAPVPFPYAARSANGKKTSAKMKVNGKNVLVEGSTMALDPPANQPAQATGGDIVTHATKNIAVMTTGSMCLTTDGKFVCATGDIAAMNVISAQSKLSPAQVPLLEAGDFAAAQEAGADIAAINDACKKAFPAPLSSRTTAGHPVDLATGYVVDDAVDLRLPGHVPLVWARNYASSFSTRRGALGKGGWFHSFEQWVEPTESGLRLHDEEGLPVDFASPSQAARAFHRGRQLELFREGQKVHVHSLRDRTTRSFAPLPGGRLALRSIRDARGHAIELTYDGDLLVEVIDSVGRRLRVMNDAAGRVVRVEVWVRPPLAIGAETPEPAPTLQTFFEYGYHAEGELAHHTDALGHAEGWDYDGRHRMTRAGLRNGVSFHYAYDDELDACVHTWGDGGVHEVRMEFDYPAGETRTHGTNRARRYLWKDGVVVREETFGGAWAIERDYDDDLLLVAIRDGAGGETKLAYDARGHLVQETDPGGNVSRYLIEDDLMVGFIDADGNETRHTFDAHGTLASVHAATGATWMVERDREGLVSTLVDRGTVRARFVHDDHANLVQDTNARGATTHFAHDALGRVVARIDPLGRRSRVDYDAGGRPERFVRPDGATVESTFDRLGNVASIRDPLGHATRFDYAGTGLIARVELADGNVFRLLYDSDERLTRIVNPRLETFELTFDRADQIVSEKTFDGRVLGYRYDKAGRLVRVDKPDDEWRELAYDPLGNVLENRGADVQLTFARDGQGRLLKAVCQDVTGKVVTEAEYDRFGRLTCERQNGRPIRYAHDEASRVVARTLPDGERTTYQFDEMDGFVGAEHEGTRFVVERDALGRESRRRGPGWAIDRTYDALDRLLSQRAFASVHGEPVGSATIDRAFRYDAAGRLTAVATPGVSTHYVYDRADQLVQATRQGTHEVFEYDPAGTLVQRLTALGEHRRAWAVAPGNVLREADGVRYVNDQSCRRIQTVEGDETAGVRTTIYGWDTLDRLREVVRADGTRVRFTYDALGRRVRKDVLGPADAAAIVLGTQTVVERRTVSFLWDGLALAEENDSSKPAAWAKRIHVLQPETFVPLMQVEGGRVYAVVTDATGVPKELLDESGTVAWRAEHGAWGDLVSATRPVAGASGNPFGMESPFRMLGQYADVETGMHHTLYRYFDPRTARWLSPDPIGVMGGMNVSGFNAAPTLHADPLGLCAKRLQELANQAYENLFGRPAAIRKRLNEAQLEAMKTEPWLIRCFFGSAVENELDALVAKDKTMADNGIAPRKGAGPDYGGNGGKTFELTTNNPGTVEAHANRNNPHNSGMVTYPALGNANPMVPR